MGIESGRSPGVPDRNGETSETGGYSDGKALLHSSCRSWDVVRAPFWGLNVPVVNSIGGTPISGPSVT